MKKKIFFLTVFIISLLFITVEVKANDSYNRWEILLTEEEIELLAKILELENGADVIESKYAVVETIFNRMVSEDYPNTLEEVLSQKGQFSTWKNKDIATPTEDTYNAIYDVLYGKTNVLGFDRLKFNNEPIGYSPIKIGKQYYGLGRKENNNNE